MVQVKQVVAEEVVEEVEEVVEVVVEEEVVEVVVEVEVVAKVVEEVVAGVDRVERGKVPDDAELGGAHEGLLLRAEVDRACDA